MVAKSFQALEQVGEPYSVSGKMYVDVKNAKTGKLRRVRWYTDLEYARLYGKEEKSEAAPKFSNQKQALGFENGYVTIFKGDTYANLEWFRHSIARYCKWWGWYIVSTDAIPFDLPAGLEPVELKWEMVGEEDGWLKNDDEIKIAVEQIIYEKSPSEFQGSIGERIERDVIISKVITGDSYYGSYAIYSMTDADENVYIWKTKPRDWQTGEEKRVRGTVKEHKTYKNVNQTILTRCMEV